MVVVKVLLVAKVDWNGSEWSTGGREGVVCRRGVDWMAQSGQMVAVKVLLVAKVKLKHFRIC